MPGAMAGDVRQFPDARLFPPDGAGVLDALGLAFFSSPLVSGYTPPMALTCRAVTGRCAPGLGGHPELHPGAGGLMIFPVLASTGIDPAAGPGLTFHDHAGGVQPPAVRSGLAVIFFLLLLVAALSPPSPCWSTWCASPPRSGAGRAAMPAGS